jgi:hypothetical protein
MAQSREQLREVAKRMKDRGYSDEDIVNAIRKLSQPEQPETPPVSDVMVQPQTQPTQPELAQPKTKSPWFTSPFMQETKAAAESGETTSPFGMFSPSVESPRLRQGIKDLPDWMIPFNFGGVGKKAAEFGLSVLEGATSPAGAVTAAIGGFAQTRGLISKGMQKYAPGLSQRLGIGAGAATATTKAATKGSNQIIVNQMDEAGRIRQVTDPNTGTVFNIADDGSLINAKTGDIIDPKTGLAQAPQAPTGQADQPEIFKMMQGRQPSETGWAPNLNLPEPPVSQNPAISATPPIKVIEPASESLFNPVLRARLHKSVATEGAEKLGQADVDQLTKYVWQNPNLAPEEQTQASIGLLKLLSGEAPLSVELTALRRVMDDDILGLMAHNSKAFRAGSPFHEAINLPRTLMATMDLSAPFRQGLGAITTAAWWKAWPPMLRALASEKYYRKAMEEILTRPNHIKKVTEGGKLGRSFSEEAGLNLASLDKISTREEAIMSSWAERIPGWGRVVRGSNRAHTLFLNKIRADNFDNLVRQGENLARTARETGRARRGLLFSEKFSPAEAELLDPKNNLQLAKDLASFVNTATGRGNLGTLENQAVNLAAVFFSPRLIASRLQYMNPKNYIFANPQVRKEYVRSLMGIATTWMSVAGLAKGAGAEVSLDPTNSDFGKMRIGNTRLDPAGGFQQYIVLAARIAAGEFTGATSGRTQQMGEGYGTKDRWDAGIDFGVNKLSPVASYIAGAMRDSDGKPFNMADEAAKRFIPIFAQDLMELIEEDPSLFALAPLAATGMGVQSFGERGDQRILPKLSFGAIPDDYEDIRPRDIRLPIRSIFGQER